MDWLQGIPEIVCLILCACLFFLGGFHSFYHVLKKLVGQKKPLRFICLKTEVLGRLERSDIDLCLEARTYTGGNGWSWASKKSSINKEKEAGSV